MLHITTDETNTNNHRYTSFDEICKKYSLNLNKENLQNSNIDYLNVILKIFNGEYVEEEEHLTDVTILNTLGIYHEANRNYISAVKYYELATNLNCIDAYLNLGYFYANIDIDPEKAIHYYEVIFFKQNEWYCGKRLISPTDKRIEFATLALASIYISKNEPDIGLKYLDHAINYCESTDAYYFIGLYHEKFTKNYPEMIKNYEIATSHGNADAHYSLGVYYAGHTKESEKAIHHHIKAMGLGKEESACFLGEYYETTNRNDELMVGCYEFAVDKGFVPAMYFLGRYYQRNKNYEKMKEYYEMGVLHYDAECMHALGFYYEIVEQDYRQAENHYLLATKKIQESPKELSDVAREICVLSMVFLGNLYDVKLKNKVLSKKYYLMATKYDSEIGLRRLKDSTTEAERLYLLLGCENELAKEECEHIMSGMRLQYVEGEETLCRMKKTKKMLHDGLEYKID